MNKSYKFRDFQFGFTLVEMMVVVAIVGVLASFALPAFRDMIRANAVWNASTSVQRVLANARTEAIKRNISVSVIPFRTCQGGVASATNWGCGLRVFTDINADRSINNGTSFGQVMNDEILSQATAPEGVIATPNGAGLTGITFTPTGSLPPTFGVRTITFCPADLGAGCNCNFQRVATIDMGGRLSVQRPACP